MSTELKWLPGQDRVLYLRDGEEVALVDFQRAPNELRLVHTEVRPQLRGQGLDDMMLQELFDSLHDTTQARVVAVCPHAARWVDRHPEYLELAGR